MTSSVGSGIVREPTGLTHPHPPSISQMVACLPPTFSRWLVSGCKELLIVPFQAPRQLTESNVYADACILTRGNDVVKSQEEEDVMRIVYDIMYTFAFFLSAPRTQAITVVKPQQQEQTSIHKPSQVAATDGKLTVYTETKSKSERTELCVPAVQLRGARETAKCMRNRCGKRVWRQTAWFVVRPFVTS